MSAISVLSKDTREGKKVELAAKLKSTLSTVIELSTKLKMTKMLLKKMRTFVEVETKNGIEYGSGYVPQDVRFTHLTPLVKMKALAVVDGLLKKLTKCGNLISSYGNPRWISYENAGSSTESLGSPTASPPQYANRIEEEEHNLSRRYSLPIQQLPILPASPRGYQIYPRQLQYDIPDDQYYEQRRGSTPSGSLERHAQTRYRHGNHQSNSLEFPGFQAFGSQSEEHGEWKGPRDPIVEEIMKIKRSIQMIERRQPHSDYGGDNIERMKELLRENPNMDKRNGNGRPSARDTHGH